ncbi:unnamed protein product [Owenia fusiformis]|uniref:Methyltransferase FkbM domain-containing protein n=1 Tax=Owenia fusiformis TaxID=6347 RepID=A0A8J1TF09_OWEFU|nr:unnamed protein product [Owenia fusiformis]
MRILTKGKLKLLITMATLVTITTYIIIKIFIPSNCNYANIMTSDIQQTATPKHVPKFGDIVNTRGTIPGAETFNCIITKKVAPIPVCMCIHEVTNDIHVSRVFAKYGYWEELNVKKILRILQENPTYRFIDIGSNLGGYTLPVLNMNREVIAVDATTVNIKRLSRSIQLSNTHHLVTLYHNAIYSERTEMVIKAGDKNIGGSQTDIVKQGAQSTKDEIVKSIYMDDLLETINFTDAVMKIDIEGSELHAFKKSQNFLDKVKVHYIFMEWVFIKNSPMRETFLASMYRRGYVPYDLFDKPLDKQTPSMWPWDIVLTLIT